jgi:hypothetical protein
MEQHKSKRSVRLALVLGAAVAGTALVGWGGLAAWQAYTQNAGNAFTTGSIGHTNQVSGKDLVCQSKSAESTSCDVIVTAANMGSTWTGATGKVTITSTASLPSTLTLSTPGAPTGPLCSDLTLAVTGADGSQYVDQTTGITNITSVPLKSDVTAPSTTWQQNDSNLFTFAVGPNNPTYENDQNAPTENCTFSVLFTQAA